MNKRLAVWLLVAILCFCVLDFIVCRAAVRWASQQPTLPTPPPVIILDGGQRSG